jgi:hypothetical protein
MKLLGLNPNFYVHVSGSNLYFPMISLIWNLYCPVLRKRTLGSTAGAERRVGNCRQAVISGSSLPSPPTPVPAVEPRVHMYDQHANFQYGKFRVVNGNS